MKNACQRGGRVSRIQEQLSVKFAGRCTLVRANSWRMRSSKPPNVAMRMKKVQWSGVGRSTDCSAQITLRKCICALARSDSIHDSNPGHHPAALISGTTPLLSFHCRRLSATSRTSSSWRPRRCAGARGGRDDRDPFPFPAMNPQEQLAQSGKGFNFELFPFIKNNQRVAIVRFSRPVARIARAP